MDLGLAGKRAIVTGGTRGIGRSIVALLIAEGCHVGFCARDPAQVENATTEFAAPDTLVLGGAVDVTNDTDLKEWVGATAEALDGLDILVPNASALVGTASADDWRLGLEVDVPGTVNAVEAALPYLEASNAASIVAISSTAAINTSGGVRACSGLKAALISYMSGLSTLNIVVREQRTSQLSPPATLSNIKPVPQTQVLKSKSSRSICRACQKDGSRCRCFHRIQKESRC